MKTGFKYAVFKCNVHRYSVEGIRGEGSARDGSGVPISARDAQSPRRARDWRDDERLKRR